MTDRDYVTGSELSRWMAEQSDFRARLEARILNQHNEVVASLRRIEDQVRETNGRTRTAEEHISAILPRLKKIEEEDDKIDTIVRSIKDEGCSQLATHAETLTLLRDGPDVWSPKKKAVVAGGLIGGGVLAWPALSEIAKAAHALIEYLGTRT